MSRLIDLTGETYGRLTVVQRVENRGGRTAWLCECSCGADKIVIGKNLRREMTQSCGCLQKERASNASLKDLRGVWFGRLVVIERAKNAGKFIRWRCKCICGKYRTVYGSNLTSGDTKSCGCFRRETSAAKLIDLTGEFFGRLEVISRGPNDNFNNTVWLCKCDLFWFLDYIE